MRVLHIITSLRTGGAERLLTDSIPIYQQKGINIDVVILKNEHTPFRAQLERNLVNTEISFLTSGSVYNPLLIFKLIPIMKKYDIIHAHLFPVLYWVVFAKLLGRIKTSIVYTEHSTNNKRRGNPFLKYIERFVYSKLTFIGCISKGTKNELLKHLSKQSNIEVINNGIDLSKFQNVKIETPYSFFNEKDKILIQVSSLRPQKDQRTLITSLNYLPKNVKLLLVGDGPLKEDLILYSQSQNLSDRVFFLGNRTDISELLYLSDIVILSSNYEGFGLVVVEGMASHKPVIASNVPGVSEIVQNYGLLFEKGDAQDLAEKIELLINDPKCYELVAEKCSLRAHDFSIEKMVDSYIHVYEEIQKK